MGDYLTVKHNCPIYMEDITLEDIESYTHYQKNRGLASSSRNRSIYVLRSFYNYCCKKDICEKDLPVLLEPIKVKEKERDFITEEEFKELVEAINKPVIRTVVQTMFYTGGRISEILDLKLSDGQLFEDMFIAIMNYAEEHFQAIKPWGNIGDRKNDGYISDKGIFYGDNQLLFDIDAKIESDTSDGVNNVKIFCYDLTILFKGYNHNIDFIFHDSRLFDGIDERQKADIFRTIYEEFSNTNKQYIATVNQNQLDEIKRQFTEDEFKNIVEDDTVLVLTDESDSQKLLGIKIDIGNS